MSVAGPVASWLLQPAALLESAALWTAPWQWLFQSEAASAYSGYNASAVTNSTDIEVRGATPAAPTSLALYQKASLSLPLPSAAHLGLATGLLLTLLFNARRDVSKERQRVEAWLSRGVSLAVWLLVAAATVPFGAALLLSCWLYRQMASAVLALTTGRDFAGLLAGPDAVWALETPTARSVINVLATLQVDDDAVDGRQLLLQLRSLLLQKLQSGALPEKLLLLRRHSPLGYFYWQRRPEPLRLDAVVREHVRFLDEDDDLEEDAARPGGWCWWGGLRRRLSQLANAPLPQGHAAGWEVLVSAAPLADAASPDPLTAMEEGLPGGGSRLFPVMLRVHHSMGDGVALMHILTSALAGSPQPSPPETPPPSASEVSFFQRVPAAPADGRPPPNIALVPTLRAMPATRQQAQTPTPPPTPVHRPRSPLGPDKERDVALWLEAAAGGGWEPDAEAERAWAPPRPATPGCRPHSAPPSRPATPFQCVIDAAGRAVSFTAAVNSRTPTLVGSAQGVPSRPTSPLTTPPPDSPIRRPASPVPPYLPAVPGSPVRRAPHKVLNGQTPYRPHSPAGLRELHYYSGACPRDDHLASSCGLDRRAPTTIYYYSATGGGCRLLSNSFSHDDVPSIAPDRPEKPRAKALERSVSFCEAEVLRTAGAQRPSKATMEDIVEETKRQMAPDKLRRAVVAQNQRRESNGQVNSTKKCESTVNTQQKQPLVVPDVKVEEECTPAEIKGKQTNENFSQLMEQLDQFVSKKPDGEKRKTQFASSGKFKLLAKNGQLHRVKVPSESENGSAGSPYAPLLQAISDSSRSRYAAALSAARCACAVVLMPAALLQQSLLHADHQLPCAGQAGGLLSGEKALSWLSEPRLLEAVRRVRRLEAARFGDVLLAALAAALDRRLGPRAPPRATVVLPGRLAAAAPPPADVTGFLDAPAAAQALENRFSVGLLALPVAGAARQAPRRRLQDVAGRTRELRASPDYQVNYWLMQVAASALPTALLGPVLRATHSSLVLSNLRGPPHPVRIAGHQVQDLVFWVPNRGSNGVGVSVLSYAGTLQLGLQLDKALALDQDDEVQLLSAITAEIHCLDASTHTIG